MIILVIKSSLRLRNFGEIWTSPSEPGSTQTISSMFGGNGNSQKYPCLQYCIFEIPDYCGTFETMHLSADSSDLDYNESDMRYMLLHELQHYKHKDAVASYLMNLAGVVYWFNPLVWYALKEMRNDREVACDTSVLKMLEEDAYEDYGNTLINFAEKVSLTPFPFAAGLGGNMGSDETENYQHCLL